MATSARRRALPAVFAALLLAASAVPATAQSTTLGRGFFSAGDVAWERIKARNPWLQHLDDTDAKTWAMHGALTYVGGRAIQATTPLSFTTGLRIVAAFYVARELYNITAEHDPANLDSAMDALVPIAVATLRVRVRFR